MQSSETMPQNAEPIGIGTQGRKMSETDACGTVWVSEREAQSGERRTAG